MTTIAAMTTSTPAMGPLTVATKAIAPIVPTQGGSTFQMNMFSSANTAFDVAVIRLVSILGRPSRT